MRTAPMLASLRRQALDDELGVVCCRPAAEAAGYFELALNLLAPSAADRALIQRLADLARGRDAAPSYEAWRRAFDLIDEYAGAGRCPAGAQAILLATGRQALQSGAELAADAVLDLYRACRAAWPAAWDHLLPALGSGLSALPDGPRTLAARVLLRAWGEEKLPAPWGAHALAAAARFPELMAHLRDPSMLGAAWFALARREIARADRVAEAIGADPAAARELLAALPATGRYEDLFAAAVDALEDSAVDCDPALCSALVRAHPKPDGLAPLLALRGALAAAGAPGEAAGWRRFVCALCRDADADQRSARARTHVTDLLSRRLAEDPAGWPEALRAAARPFGAAYPGVAERSRWHAEAAALPGLRPAHVAALAALAPAAAWAAAKPWNDLGEALGGRLRAADRQAWCGIALDLLAAAQTWDPPALAATTSRWRSFVHVLLMSQPALTDLAGRLLACQRETLEGALKDACLALRPGRDPAELDALRACGVGTGLA